ncbi:5,10-methylenetetrahydrofolate reductase [Candidatus Termititenax aidoneus]|uniref:Methylenetetrahydrofolate reductase n=1 Tax=Termititenax aidoneus TaxID=2218524 RepID=A0A388T9T1_TERA1|nr:5,10-methylenetetrahydrofolate reductase [Candidatus Termititenax aidoneus]
MRLTEIYQQPPPIISLEISPPKTDDGLASLLTELKKLKQLNPSLISLTYGAGGTTQGRSLLLLEKIRRELNLELMTHLTCIGSSEKSILAFLQKVSGWGIENILALRGDWPRDNPGYQPESDTFKHAADLIRFVKKNTALSVAAAGFPEKHPEAENLQTGLKHLEEKTAAGAEVVFTQLFFDNQYYYDYVKSARTAGIDTPIIPGIWTITNLKQIQRVAELSCAKIPAELLARLEKAGKQEVREIGIDYAATQIRDLLKHGAPGVHLYTLNKADAVSAVLRKL